MYKLTLGLLAVTAVSKTVLCEDNESATGRVKLERTENFGQERMMAATVTASDEPIYQGRRRLRRQSQAEAEKTETSVESTSTVANSSSAQNVTDVLPPTPTTTTTTTTTTTAPAPAPAPAPATASAQKQIVIQVISNKPVPTVTATPTESSTSNSAVASSSEAVKVKEPSVQILPFVQPAEDTEALEDAYLTNNDNETNAVEERMLGFSIDVGETVATSAATTATATLIENIVKDFYKLLKDSIKGGVKSSNKKSKEAKRDKTPVIFAEKLIGKVYQELVPGSKPRPETPAYKNFVKAFDIAYDKLLLDAIISPEELLFLGLRVFLLLNSIDQINAAEEKPLVIEQDKLSSLINTQVLPKKIAALLGSGKFLDLLKRDTLIELQKSLPNGNEMNIDQIEKRIQVIKQGLAEKRPVA